MGVDLSIWKHFPLLEIAALLLFTTAYAAGFHILTSRRFQASGGVQPMGLAFVGGLGFAVIALLLQSAALAYMGETPSYFEIVLLAIGFLVTGLAGSGLSVGWLRRRRHSGPATLRSTVGVVVLFWVGVLSALLLYRLLAGGLLLLLFT